MKFQSKADLLEAIEREHEAFVDLVESIPSTSYARAGVWGDGWTIKDLCAHLTEWERMFLRWYRDGREGREPDVPAVRRTTSGTEVDALESRAEVDGRRLLEHGRDHD